jgi:inhibitor of cysteine peptidase
MFTIRNVLLLISSLVLSGVLVLVARDIIWNKRLNDYKNKFKLNTKEVKTSVRFERLLMAGSTALLILLAVIVPTRTYQIGERVLVNARPVLTKTKLNSLVEQNNLFNKALFSVMPSAESSITATDTSARVNDVIGTNLQVEGVDEADIIKTDGNSIYYATRGYNRIRIVDVLDNKLVDIKDDLLLGDLYTDSLYLTAEHLIVVGYSFDESPYVGCAEGMACIGFGRMWFMPSTGTVKVFNRDDLSLAYSLETDGMFYDHRLIEDKLFLMSHKNLFGQEELRPTFKSNINGVASESFVEYESIYYFDNVPAYEITVLTGIDLASYTHNAQAFLGGVDHLYVSLNSVYTIDNYYQENLLRTEYAPKVQIIKYDINLAEAKLDYVGQVKLDGVIEDQFWTDEYNGYFRAVTTSSIWSEQGVTTKNRLFIIESNDVDDQLNIVGSITENLGKPGETVKAVRFNGDLGQVVTFEQIDPLYTIDLSNPSAPIITGAIEEPGYSTYLHNWTDTNLIGIGFDIVEQRINGLKISAYDTALTEPLTTYFLSEKSNDGTFNYSYSEAVYNHKALMISSEKGILAFPVSKFSYKEETVDNVMTYTYTYQSEYLVFFIDFSKPAKEIISEPIRISHKAREFDSAIDRGVYINNVIYTLSFGQLVSFDLSTNQVLETLEFPVIIES